jgi:large subunit ribosomal protein L35
MPKLKTNKAAKKRFKVLKSKKVKRLQAYRRHLLDQKSPKDTRQSRRSTYVAKCDIDAVKQLLPYSF